MRLSPVLLAALLLGTLGQAATSPRAATSPMEGNGHNVSFDGRLFIATHSVGWEATLLRPEQITLDGGFPDLGHAFTPWVLVQPQAHGENGLALCEATAQPTACSGPDGGTFDCYDEFVIAYDGTATGTALEFYRRKLRVRVSNPRTPQASIAGFEWLEDAATPLSPVLRGIEPTVTRDGKLLVWNGSQDNQGSGDELVYSVNPTPCAIAGWSAPKSLSAMSTDPAVQGTYRLAERRLKAADGTLYPDGARIRGAYPWVFPDGEAVNYAATPMHCRQPAGAPGFPNGDPAGCGPRRNGWSVLGYPTNWQAAHVDGEVNPDTDQTVRLFFSSPTPTAFPNLPHTRGTDVWPFFGSNTANYTEIVFDDGLDGRYGALWHMNELVTADGELDTTRVADSSGYSNTGRARFKPAGGNLLGSEQTFDGMQGTSVADAPALNPTGFLSVSLTLTPATTPALDCDANNNWRVPLIKGTWTGGYSLVLEETGELQARVNTSAGIYNVVGQRIPLGQPTAVTFTYDPLTGRMELWFDGAVVARTDHPPSPLAPVAGPLYVGGPDTAQPACPNGLGAFAGTITDVAVSSTPPAPAFGFPAKNNGLLGKAMVFAGADGRIEVPDAPSLKPTSALTVQLAVKPASDPDCDANNNWRVLLTKGQVPDGSYSLVLEEDRHVRGRVRVAGGAVYTVGSTRALTVGAWAQVGLTYDAATGALELWLDGVRDAASANAPALLAALTDTLAIAGPVGGAAGSCPNGHGGFAGTVDEVAISSIVRDLRPPPPDGVADAGAAAVDAGTDGGQPGADGGPAPGSGSDGGSDPASRSGCGCAAGSMEGALAIWLVAAAGARLRRGRRG